MFFLNIWCYVLCVLNILCYSLGIGVNFDVTLCIAGCSTKVKKQ